MGFRDLMTLLSTPTGTAPSTVDATATAVTVLLDAVPTQGSAVALKRSGPTLPAMPEITGLVQLEESKF